MEHKAETLKSKRSVLIVFAVTAMICSRVLFFFIADPEGPNLLIVGVLGLVIFVLSSVVFLFSRLKASGATGILATIGFQMLLVVVLYFMMK